MSKSSSTKSLMWTNVAVEVLTTIFYAYFRWILYVIFEFIYYYAGTKITSNQLI